MLNEICEITEKSGDTILNNVLIKYKDFMYKDVINIL